MNSQRTPQEGDEGEGISMSLRVWLPVAEGHRAGCPQTADGVAGAGPAAVW